MSESKTTSVASVASALLLAALLTVQVTPREEQPPRWEYDVVSIGDAEWHSKAQDLGSAGWEIVTARRASDSDGNFAYECIVKRPRR